MLVIPNRVVLQRAGVTPLSQQVRARHLFFFGEVARAPPDHPLRRHTFVDDALTPHVGRYVRRVGRPRQDWTNCVLNDATFICGGSANLFERINDKAQWRAHVLNNT